MDGAPFLARAASEIGTLAGAAARFDSDIFRKAPKCDKSVLVGQPGGGGMLGWFMLTGALLLAYAGGYATREIISRQRRRKAEEIRRMRSRRSAIAAKI